MIFRKIVKSSFFQDVINACGFFVIVVLDVVVFDHVHDNDFLTVTI